VTLELDVAPVAYAQTETDWLPGFQPYVYQWRVHQLVQEALVRNETLCLFLTTPTGSGKTLASYAHSIKTGMPVLGVYPTNELIRDQERALEPEYRRALGWDDWVLRIDSASLDQWGLDLGEPYHARALETLLRWRRVVLTNPDILFYTAFGRYPDIQGQRQRLFGLLGDVYRLFVFDEFHLYNVKQVADVTFFIGALQAIRSDKGRVFIFASATPDSPARLWLRDKLNLRVEAVQGEPSHDPMAHVIAHPVRLTVLPADLARWKGTETLAESLPLVDAFLRDHPSGRLVTILDAVAGAINVAQMFREHYPAREVGEIHGFSSAQGREEALRRPITVGTSTIEVGIDFKDEAEKDVLIFEARTASQFVQRFGRLARHRKSSPIPNWTLALVPEYVYHFLVERIPTGRPLTRTELYHLIDEAYQPPQDFATYLSKHAPAEFHAAKWFIGGLFQRDDRPRINAGLDHVIKALTGKTGGHAAALHRRYEEEGIVAPMMTFRGASFQVAILDERGTDLGFPARRYGLMFVLRRGIFEELQAEEYLERLEALARTWPDEVARERRYAKPIKPGPDELLGVYGFFSLTGLLDKGRKVWFEVDEDEVRGRKGQVTVVRGLRLVTEPSTRLRKLNRLLHRKRIAAWFLDRHPASIKLGRALPPLFAVYELRVRQAGGAPSGGVWAIAFNQDAFFVDSLGWWAQQREDQAIIL
jgi:CRISPR-associated endonuclease/helicase Cas3